MTVFGFLNEEGDFYGLCCACVFLAAASNHSAEPLPLSLSICLSIYLSIAQLSPRLVTNLRHPRTGSPARVDGGCRRHVSMVVLSRVFRLEVYRV